MRRRYVLAVQCGCPRQLLPTCCAALARAAALAGGRALVVTVHDSSQSVYKVPQQPSRERQKAQAASGIRHTREREAGVFFQAPELLYE